MILSQNLFAQVGYPNPLPVAYNNLSIAGISSDSRYAKAGDLFFAYQGQTSHGLDYMETLLEKKVSIILYEGEKRAKISSEIPILRVDNIEEWIPKFTQIFYREKIASLSLIGVTGTEGKTSVTQFIAKAYKALFEKCAVIGTNGIGFLDDLKDNTHTTPNLVALYRSLAEISDGFGAQITKPVAIEVTSHALVQKRVNALTFEATIFTNLTRDHLDYHGSIEEYKQAKSRLFFEYPSKASIINIDDATGIDIYTHLLIANNRALYPYGANQCSHNNHLKISELKLNHDGLSFMLTFQKQKYLIKSQLYGSFNAYNLTAMIATLLFKGHQMEDIIEIIPHLSNVKGRMERVPLTNGAIAIIDYAHKPNALLQALQSLREHLTNGRLIVVFGCGGDRDKGKRPIMGAIAEEYADMVIVTSDNPRHEPPAEIIKEICEGFKFPHSDPIKVIGHRREAIEYAYSIAQKGDIILIAGKGHEEYQLIGDKVDHFSDIEEIERLNIKELL